MTYILPEQIQLNSFAKLQLSIYQMESIKKNFKYFIEHL